MTAWPYANKEVECTLTVGDSGTVFAAGDGFVTDQALVVFYYKKLT